MTTADVIREVKRIAAIDSPLAQWEAVTKADGRVTVFYRALNATAGDFVEYYISRVHTDDLPALLQTSEVGRSKVKTAATGREIRRRARAAGYPALPRCPVCGADELIRERRIDGFARCVAGHVYPSHSARRDKR